MQLDDNARRIFDLRYSIKDDEGNPTETPREAVKRVAQNVASVTVLYGEDGSQDDHGDYSDPWPDPNSAPMVTARRQYEWLKDRSQKSFRPFHEVVARGKNRFFDQAQKYELLIADRFFLPNSPTWTGAGTGLGQLSACFVLPIADDLGRKRDSIFETLKVAALIQQTGGGNGFSFGDLRPRGALVNRSKGRATGPVGFLQAYDAAFGIIAQGGTRRGANMGILPVDHPDIREFIEAKITEGVISNFNISVAITDDFMEAVEKDGDFDLHFDGKVSQTIRAKDLYDEIIANAWIIGDPGNLFIDKANVDNPCPTRYRLKATNPCGEQWLGPYENCCLGSIAVQHFATWRTDSAAVPYFSWEALRRVVVTSTEFLDDVVDANQYVEGAPELEAAGQGGRRIGLGIMGLGDGLAKMGLRYGSPEALDFTSQMMEFIRYHAMLTSVQRAKERGPFPWIHNSIYDPKLLSEQGPGAPVTLRDHHDGQKIVAFTLWAPPQPIVGHERDFGRPDVNWDDVVDGITEYGIRNSCQLTVAPTGTISNVAMCECSGCEPMFALAFTRNVMQEGENISLTYTSGLFEQALATHGFDAGMIDIIAEAVVDNGGSCQGVEGVPLEVQHAFPVSADVSPQDHVWMQAVLQAWVDNSISKTINMPNEATKEDVSDAFRLAYSLGCKGITIYRQGSRELEVLTVKPHKTTGEEKVSVEVSDEFWPTIRPLPIPQSAQDTGLVARVIPVETPFGKVQVTITELESHPGRPFDVRLQLGKAGNDKNADVEAFGRMLSGNTRAGVSVEWIVDQLEGIGGQSVIGYGPNRVRSIADGVAKLLKRRYMDGDGLQPSAPSWLTPLREAGINVQVDERVPPGQFLIAGAGDSSLFVDMASGSLIDPNTVCPKCHNATLVMESGCKHCDVRLGGCGEYEGCE